MKQSKKNTILKKDFSFYKIFNTRTFKNKYKANSMIWIGGGSFGQVFCVESVENQKMAIKVMLIEDNELNFA